MCRAGGRRCPGQYDPVKREQINARRRAAYARKKAIERGEVIVETAPQHSGGTTTMAPPAPTIAPGTPPPPDPSPASMEQYHRTLTAKRFIEQQEKHLPETLYGADVNGFTGKDLWDASTVEVPHEGIDGVFKTKNTGALAGSYFNDTTVHGTLYRKEIEQGNAAESFGFKEIPENSTYFMESTSDFLEDDFIEMSQYELSQISSEEREALEMYTADHYEWINNALFDKVPATEEYILSANPSVAEVKDEMFRMQPSRDMLDTMTNALDGALDQGQKRQRILYRSASVDSNIFIDEGLTAEEWVDEHMTVGQEYVFDGYQSSTPVPAGMKSFASDDGMIYEILTPEGINITDVSGYKEEHEVLLPRNARYMVVEIKKGVDVSLRPGITYENNTVVRLVAINEKGEVLNGTNSNPVA